VAAQAKYMRLGARLAREIAGVGIVANQALSIPVRPMQDGVFLGLVAHGAQFPPCRHKRYARFAVLRSRLVATFTTHIDSGVDKLTFFLVRMASEAGFGLDGIRLNKGMLGRLPRSHPEICDE
jgi:hypothetical protein